MGKAIEWILAFFVKKLGGKVVLLAVTSSYVLASVAFFYFVMQVLVTLYNSISSLLDYMSNPPVSGDGAFSQILPQFFGLLNCMGFNAALNNAMPLFFTALVFVLTMFAKTLFLRVHEVIVKSIYRLIN